MESDPTSSTAAGKKGELRSAAVTCDGPKRKAKGSAKKERRPELVDRLPEWAATALEQDAASRRETPVDLHKPEFHLEPGAFDVVLLVDVMEVAGSEQVSGRMHFPFLTAP